MKILFSVPTGYHLRELLLPLRPLLEKDADITQVICLTPAAAYRQQIFSEFSDKFSFVSNPQDLSAHKELLETHQPDLVITDTVGHDELDYPILETAKHLHIPTLTFIASWDNVWKIKRLMDANKPISLADRFVVWNTMMKDHLLRLFPQKIQPDHIHVIGAPRLDYFFHHKNIPSKEDLYAHLGFKDIDRPLIHIATTELYSMDYVVAAIHSAAQNNQLPKNPHLYASIHPGGDLSRHDYLKKYHVTYRYSFGRDNNAPLPSFLYHPTDQDIYMLVALFTHADLLINHSSSVALESLLGKTPVINVKYGRPLDWWHWYRSMVYRDFKEHYVDLVKDGATTIVHNQKQLVHAASNLLQNPTQNESARLTTIKRMITTTDGTASQKMLDLIKRHS